MTPLQIRAAASPEDLLHAHELFEEYGASLGVDLGFQNFAHELASLPGDYEPPLGALLLAELNGAVVGCVALRPLEPPHTAELKRLYVRPAGRGHGIGMALTEAILQRAHAAGYACVRLDTLPTMGAAQRMYQRLGFREIPAYRHNPVPGTRYLELRLDDASDPAI